MSKNWQLRTQYLRNLGRAIARPHPVDRSGKPLFADDGTQIRTATGEKIVRKRPAMLKDLPN